MWGAGGALATQHMGEEPLANPQVHPGGGQQELGSLLRNMVVMERHKAIMATY